MMMLVRFGSRWLLFVVSFVVDAWTSMSAPHVIVTCQADVDELRTTHQLHRKQKETTVVCWLVVWLTFCISHDFPQY